MVEYRSWLCSAIAGLDTWLNIERDFVVLQQVQTRSECIFLLHRACANLDTWKVSDVNVHIFFRLRILGEGRLYYLALTQM
jgi:hypothetical protein